MIAHFTVVARARLSPAGYRKLDTIRFLLNRLYNLALEDRKTAWEQEKRRVTYYDQAQALSVQRRADPDGLGRIALGPARGMLKRLDEAYRAFYRRCKHGEAPGYPRFRPIQRMETIDVTQVSPGMVRAGPGGHRLQVKGFPTIRIYPTRELPDSHALKSVQIVRKPHGVCVSLVYEVEQEPLPASMESVGIDMGVRQRMTLSSGATVAPARVDWGAIRRAQRCVSRSKKGSNARRKRVRRLAAMRHRAKVRNRNGCHRATTAIVRRHGLIAVEQLRINNMTRAASGTAEEPGRNVAQKRGLNRSIQSQTWGILRSQLRYKAAWAGREFVEVNPAYTSQDCHQCGSRNNPGSRETYNCKSCGLTFDREVNAAINIMRAGNLALASLTCPVAECVDAERCT